MKLPNYCLLFCVTALLATSVALASAAEVAPPGKVLDISGESVTKREVGSSMIGFRNTLIFYAFNDQKAVLRVAIDNKNKDFPVSATIYEFADGVTGEGLAKWINNQHSDGLFPDVPEPVKTHPIPAEACKAIGHKLAGTSEAPNGAFENYTVTFEISGVPAIGGTMLKDLTDKATVRVKKG